MTYQLVFSDLPAGPDGVPCVTMANNLMTSSTRWLMDGQQTDVVTVDGQIVITDDRQTKMYKLAAHKMELQHKGYHSQPAFF